MIKLDRIEGLRAPLAWWVVIAHVIQSSGLRHRELAEPFQFLYLGIVPVYGFMIISGFVIAHLILMKKENYAAYIFRRYFRLAPLMLVCIVVAWFINQFLFEPIYWPDDNHTTRLLLQATLLHGVVPESWLQAASMMYSSPGWSVSLEWQFYLVAPLIVYCFRRQGLWLLIPTIMLAMSLFLGFADSARTLTLGDDTSQFIKPSFLLSTIVYFIIGMCFYFLYKRIGALRGNEIAGLLLIGIALFFAPLDDRLMSRQIVVIIAIVAYVIFWDRSFVASLFKTRLFTWLGKISYSTYLLHYFVVSIAAHYLAPFVDEKWPLFWAILLIAIPGTLAVSAAGYYLVEKPFMTFAQKISLRLNLRNPTT